MVSSTMTPSLVVGDLQQSGIKISRLESPGEYEWVFPTSKGSKEDPLDNLNRLGDKPKFQTYDFTKF